MRKLRLTVSRARGALPVLVLATLLPAGGACSEDEDPDPNNSSGSVGASNGGATASGSGAAGGAGAGGGFVGPSSSSTGTGGEAACDVTYSFEVDIPPEGVPAEPGQICAVALDPVSSNAGARVTLVKESDLHVATGMVEIAPALMGMVEGLPTIEVIDAQAPELLGMQVTAIAAAANGFSFHAEWPAPLSLPPESWVRMTVRATFTLACGPMEPRTVESITHIHLCAEPPDVAWVSSGDVCNVCDIIAEMAPSPIVPDVGGDDLPLGRVLRLQVKTLARVGRALVLLADHDGGEGQEHDWRCTAGEIERLAPDVVVWTPPDAPGPHLVQAAVHSDEAVAVASMTWPEVA
jgi:hypothetical protein